MAASGRPFRILLDKTAGTNLCAEWVQFPHAYLMLLAQTARKGVAVAIIRQQIGKCETQVFGYRGKPI